MEPRIGCTTKRLSERICEHHVTWPNARAVRPIITGVSSHIVDPNHSVNVMGVSFDIQIPGWYSRLVKCLTITIGDAIGTWLSNLPLCSQMQFIQTNAPWPSHIYWRKDSQTKYIRFTWIWIIYASFQSSFSIRSTITVSPYWTPLWFHVM